MGLDKKYSFNNRDNVCNSANVKTSIKKIARICPVYLPLFIKKQCVWIFKKQINIILDT